MDISHKDGEYFARIPVRVVQKTVTKLDSVEVVTVKHGGLYYVSRVFVEEGVRYPQHWNECTSLSKAQAAHDDLAGLRPRR